MSRKIFLALATVGLLVSLSGCGANKYGQPGNPPSPNQVAEQHTGTIYEIRTPFDEALECAEEKLRVALGDKLFSVGNVQDGTGKQSLDGGTGYYVQQTVGDSAQSALFAALGEGHVVNRRDPRAIMLEINMGIRQKETILPADYSISGSISGLDFDGGESAELAVHGVGPQYRTFASIIMLDLALTNHDTSMVVANSSPAVVISGEESGFGVFSFFGGLLVEFNAGQIHRQYMQFTVRESVKYVVFDLLRQYFADVDLSECSAKIDNLKGVRYHDRAKPPEEKVEQESVDLGDHLSAPMS